ncbi:MAG: hypothetical protein DCF19_01965 [Pseudanabaena frigida]|uniref:Uncharacterized protein n=1 Tax=Pseudanabaena frigida TaxID=945775 RepID=A0A2W4WI39_9CYAN|nr:MAG: hypothetical protein DCF19_01965 [Pseudanabaena frigida]
MATPHRTKQVNLRFPLPLLSQIKSQADAKQQAIADWILAVVSREFTPEATPESSAETSQFTLHPDLLAYVESCLNPLQSQIAELRTQLGESKA